MLQGSYDRMDAKAGARGRAHAGRFDQVTIALHWITAGLVGAQLATAWLVRQGGPGAATSFAAHRSLGVVIWMVVAVRLIWRSRYAYLPPFPPTMPPWQQQTAKLSELGLYALLLLQPLTGLASVLFRGRSFTLLALRVPAVLPPQKAMVHILQSAHEAGAAGLLGLIAVHAGAALFHEFRLRDGVLRRMLPWTPP